MSGPYRAVERDEDYGSMGVETVYDVLGPGNEIVHRRLRHAVDASARAQALNIAYAAGQAAAIARTPKVAVAEVARLRAALEGVPNPIHSTGGGAWKCGSCQTEWMEMPEYHKAGCWYGRVREALAATPAPASAWSTEGVRQEFEQATERLLGAAHPTNAEDRALIERAIANMTRSNVGAPSGLSAVFLPHDQIDRLLVLAEKGLDR